MTIISRAYTLVELVRGIWFHGQFTKNGKGRGLRVFFNSQAGPDMAILVPDIDRDNKDDVIWALPLNMSTWQLWKAQALKILAENLVDPALGIPWIEMTTARGLTVVLLL